MYNMNFLTLGLIYSVVLQNSNPINGQGVEEDQNNSTYSPTTTPTGSPSYLTQATRSPTISTTLSPTINYSDSETSSSHKDLKVIQVVTSEPFLIAAALFVGFCCGATAYHICSKKPIDHFPLPTTSSHGTIDTRLPKWTLDEVIERSELMGLDDTPSDSIQLGEL
jgi:hypothetical protein